MNPTQRTGEWVRQMMDRHGRTVYALAYARTRSAADADDIFQEVFLRLLACDTPFAGDEHVKAWLIRVTHNLSCNLVRSAWRRLTVGYAGQEPRATPEPQYEALQMALSRLPAKYRSVIHLFYYEDMTIAQIAQAFDMKPATVRAQLTRGRAKLKAQLGEGGNGHA